MALLWHTRGFPVLAGDPVGPALFPKIISFGFGFAGISLIARDVRARSGRPWLEFPSWFREPRKLAGFLLVVVGLLAYCQFVEMLGFFVCAPLLLAALFLILRVRLWTIPLISIAMTLLIHVIFYKGLGVPLPWGLLQAWAW